LCRLCVQVTARV
jgi:hypothetical protein